MKLVRNATRLRKTADAFIAATNAYDVDAVLKLFAPDAVIDDPSTGHCFDGHRGIRTYIEQFFIAYHTVTRFLSLEILSADLIRVRVDFTGDFGHEIGLLDMSALPSFFRAGPFKFRIVSPDKARGYGAIALRRLVTSRKGQFKWRTPSENPYIVRGEARRTIESRYADVAFAISST
jgi:ketosteroid isomerase-like protein